MTSLHLVVGEAYYLNVNAGLQLQAMQLGGSNFTPLTDKESKSSPQDFERSWDSWKARLPHQ